MSTTTHAAPASVKTTPRTRSGIITDIQRWALHDGPGIRTTVFFKGCPLRCVWCHNPETIAGQPQLLFDSRRCIGCGACIRACPEGAHRAVDGEHRVDLERCTACGACAERCASGALTVAGRRVEIDDVMKQVLRDRAFYRNSGGGLTLSGGEPLAQPAFCRELLAAAHTESVHTALDTSGAVPWPRLEAVLPFTDLVLYDVKIMNAARCRELTGMPSTTPLRNLRALDATGKPIWIRIPLVPGCNDADWNLHAMARFLDDLRNVERVELLRYHPLGAGKREQLGQNSRLKETTAPSKEHAESKRQILLNHGVEHVRIR